MCVVVRPYLGHDQDLVEQQLQNAIAGRVHQRASEDVQLSRRMHGHGWWNSQRSSDPSACTARHGALARPFILPLGVVRVAGD